MTLKKQVNLYGKKSKEKKQYKNMEIFNNKILKINMTF